MTKSWAPRLSKCYQSEQIEFWSKKWVIWRGGYLEDKVILGPVCITGCCCSVELASTSSTFPENWNSHYVQDGVPSHVTLIASVYILCDPNQKAGDGCSKESRRASHSLSARFMLQPGTEWSRLTASGTRCFSENGLAALQNNSVRSLSGRHRVWQT